MGEWKRLNLWKIKENGFGWMSSAKNESFIITPSLWLNVLNSLNLIAFEDQRIWSWIVLGKNFVFGFETLNVFIYFWEDDAMMVYDWRFLDFNRIIICFLLSTDNIFVFFYLLENINLPTIYKKKYTKIS